MTEHEQTKMRMFGSTMMWLIASKHFSALVKQLAAADQRSTSIFSNAL